MSADKPQAATANDRRSASASAGTHPEAAREPPAPEADYDYDEEAEYGNEDEIDRQEELVGKWQHVTQENLMLSPVGMLEWLLQVQPFGKVCTANGGDSLVCVICC